MDDATSLYLDLMKKTLTGVIYCDPSNRGGYDDRMRQGGEDWPATAHTMVGLQRLNNLQECIEGVLADGVAGDIIETGVWRGGASIFARAVLRAHGVTDRKVWVADSFQGMPVADETSRGIDNEMRMHRFNEVLAVSLQEVQENFRRYELLDDQVEFLPGWFADTLPTAPITRLAVLRLDGDLYESTMDALAGLYPKLSVGGYVIVDDYGLETCRRAVEDYRAEHGITDEVTIIDSFGAYWRRTDRTDRTDRTGIDRTGVGGS
jgi:Macrocin-O-methyltransferase (TylF)